MADIITRRSVIRSMRDRWEKQYEEWHDCRRFSDGTEKSTISRQLAALDLETCGREAINAIVGNTGWTAIWCVECARDVEKAVIFHDNSGDNSVTVCADCVTKAAAGLDGC